MEITIENVDKFTNKQIVDFVRNKLVEQGEGSYCSEASACMYRIKKGNKVLKCSIGHLIPDDLYKWSIEQHALNGNFFGYSANNWFEYFYPDIIISEEKVNLLKWLQAVHDDHATELNFVNLIKRKMIWNTTTNNS